VVKVLVRQEHRASRELRLAWGIEWVLLTNGIEWRLFHLTFAEGEGIAHDVAFSLSLPEQVEKDAAKFWEDLSSCHELR